MKLISNDGEITMPDGRKVNGACFALALEHGLRILGYNVPASTIHARIHMVANVMPDLDVTNFKTPNTLELELLKFMFEHDARLVLIRNEIGTMPENKDVANDYVTIIGPVTGKPVFVAATDGHFAAICAEEYVELAYLGAYRLATLPIAPFREESDEEFRRTM